MGRGLVLTAVVAVLTPQADPAAAAAWRRYTSDRFGTSIAVPAGFLMGPAPANDDGRVFRSPDGRITVTVSGSYAPMVVTRDFDTYRGWMEEEARADGTRLTFAAGTSAGFVLSGTRAGRIVYRRVVAGCPDRSVAHALEITYSVADKARFNALVARVSRSLTPGSADFCR